MEQRDEHSLFIDNSTGAIKPELIGMSNRDVKLTNSQIQRITNAMRRWIAMKKVHILKMDKNSLLA